jgi:hypothetical protein
MPFVPVFVIQYFLCSGFEVEERGGGGGIAVVDAFAMPRKRWSVDGRGRAIGLRNWRDIEEDMVELQSVVSCWSRKALESRTSQKNTR